MKYCVSARQPLKVIKKADEVWVSWKDREYIADLIVEAPEIKINLEVVSDGAVSYRTIKQYREEGANISLALNSFNTNVEFCKENEISFFWNKRINNYWELRSAVELGVSEVMIDAPLYFELESVAHFGVPIRVRPNLAYDSAGCFHHEDGIKGTYIRPEDIILYESYVSTIDFYSENLTQEETLLKIYKEDRKWPGNLKILITNLNEDIDNRALPKEFGKIRMNCRQRCMKSGTCHFCDTAFRFGTNLLNI